MAKPARRARGFAFLIIAALIAIAGSAAIVARSWPKMFAPAIVKKDDPVPEKKSGHIIVSRTNSELCDHFLFDNKSGAMTAVETSRCAGKRETPILADQVNSFSSSWRGGARPTSPRAETVR